MAALLNPIKVSMNEQRSRKSVPREPVFSTQSYSNSSIPFTVDSQEDINFIDKLRSSRGNFSQQLSRTQPQQNTLIRLCSILHNNFRTSPYGDLFMVRLGQILRCLGQRLNLKEPLCHFIEFNMQKVLQFVNNRQHKEPYRSIAVSVLGLHPPIQVTQQNYESLPLFVIALLPDSPSQKLIFGNRNWRKSRFILEKKTEKSDWANDEAEIISGWLLGRLPDYFSSLSWIHSLYSQLYEYYYTASMEILTRIYESSITNIDKAVNVSIISDVPPFSIDYKDIHNKISRLDHLSILLIDVLIRDGNYEQLIKEMLYFPIVEQYEHGLQLALAILYHRQPSPQIKQKLIQFGQKLNNIEAILPLVSKDQQQIIQYYNKQQVDQPTRFSMYRDSQLRSKLAVAFWQKNKEKVLELRDSLSESVFPLKILESINIMEDINDIQKALEEIKNKKPKVKSENEFSRLLEEWKELVEIVKNKKSIVEEAKQIKQLLKSNAKEVPPSQLMPVRHVKRWLIFMLLRIIDSALKNRRDDLLKLAKQSFVATKPYIFQVIDSETLELDVLPKMAELLIQDSDFLRELL